MKSFEDLLKDLGEGDEEVTDEEVEIRAEVFLNAYRAAENWHRKQLNNLSFQLNKRFLAGCGARELLWFYNEKIGGILDDFIY